MVQRNSIFVVDKETSNGFAFHFVKMATGIIKTYFYNYGCLLYTSDAADE